MQESLSSGIQTTGLRVGTLFKDVIIMCFLRIPESPSCADGGMDGGSWNSRRINPLEFQGPLRRRISTFEPLSH